MTSTIARILDAAANRAREAARVLEDIARFGLDDALLLRRCKDLRHGVTAILAELPRGWLEANRDAANDVGVEITVASEQYRPDLSSVARAAGRRAAEALRSLEETLKTHDPRLAARVERLRYEAYEIEAAVLGRLPRGVGQWRICVLLTDSVCRLPWQDVVRGAVEAGADCIQVREPTWTGGPLAERVAGVLEISRSAEVAVIVNDRVDVALATGADGVHLGREDLSIDMVRSIAGRSLLVGVSARDHSEQDSAVAAGADYCGLGAMFATTTKVTRPPIGPSAVRRFVERYPDVPHLAVGGIELENMHEVIASGARGVAVCGAVCAAEDPAATVRRLHELMEAPGTPALPAERA